MNISFGQAFIVKSPAADASSIEALKDHCHFKDRPYAEHDLAVTTGKLILTGDDACLYNGARGEAQNRIAYSYFLNNQTTNIVSIKEA